MAIEDELEPVEKPKPVPLVVSGVHRTYRAVGILYREDLQHIYRAIDGTLDAEKAERQEDLEFWTEEKAWACRARQHTDADRHIAQAQQPLIHLQSEEFKYPTLDHVFELPRRGYREFRIEKDTYPTLEVKIKPSKVSVDTYSDDPAYRDACDKIEEVIQRRQNHLLAVTFHPMIITIWWILVFLAVVVMADITVIRNGHASLAVVLVPNLIIYGGLFVRLLYWFLYSRRQIVVVPKYEAEVYQSFWARHEGFFAFIGAIGALVSVAVVIYGILHHFFG